MTVKVKKQAHYITVGSKRLPLIATKHPTARRLVVRYDARAEVVKVTLPRYASFTSALEFAESKAWWIEQQLGKKETIAFAPGAVIPLFGEVVRLEHAGGRGVVTIGDGVMRVPGGVEFMPRRVREAIRQRMQVHVETLAAGYAERLGVRVARIALRETSSRWGSCSSRGTLSFCWRLAFAPFAVMEYLVCHEVCHLRQHNHSAEFWTLVESLCPDYRQAETWLDTHGRSLWRYGE